MLSSMREQVRGGRRWLIFCLCAALVRGGVRAFQLPPVGLRVCSDPHAIKSNSFRRFQPPTLSTLRMGVLGASSSEFDIQVSTVMGIEAVTKQELAALGYPDSTAKNGRVEFRAGQAAIPRCNLWLRSATRVLIKLAEFEATTFDELFDGVHSIPWGDVIHPGAAFPVRGKSVRSQLHSVPACQSIVKKAITKKLLTLRGDDPDHEDSWLEESERHGVCEIEVALLKDTVTICLDTSGDALAKRGYRPGVLKGGAPLKETLAASMLLLSRWTPDRPLYDPFCGSGTILLEAALMAKNIAPGLRRSFAAEQCPLICSSEAWASAFEEAEDLIVRDTGDTMMFGSDVDRRAVDMTFEHLRRAGLESLVQLSVADVHAVPPPPGDYGCVVTNPPYGERLGDSQRANEGLGRLMAGLGSWSLFALSGDGYLESDLGKKATKRRKLYNGKLPCQLYQYFGPLPPRDRGQLSDDAAPRTQQGSAEAMEGGRRREHPERRRAMGGRGGRGGGRAGRGGSGGLRMSVLMLFGGRERDTAQRRGVRVRGLGWAGPREGAPGRTTTGGSRLQMSGDAAKEQEGRASTQLTAQSDEGIHRRIKSWVCIKQCGACCFLGAEQPDLQALKDPDERALYKSMIAPSGWCKHFDLEQRSCTIYNDRPRFCRTEPEIFEDIFEVPADEFVEAAVESCLEAIDHLYGEQSQEFERYQQYLDAGNEGH